MPPLRENDPYYLLSYRVDKIEKELIEFQKHVKQIEMLINQALGALLILSMLATAVGYIISRL